VISLQAAGKSFDSHWVFRDVNLHVPPGASAAVVGPSGSGKSVLLKLIAGLLLPDEGAVGVESSDVGMLFQRNALFDSLTVIDNLLFPLRERKGIIGKDAQDRARQYLHWVGLDHVLDHAPDQLSGGMQKRLGIARALVLEPSVVLYDDPTAGLDPVTSRKIAELIRSLQTKHHSGKKTTFVAVTNDMHRAYQLGDQIYLLAQGKLVLGGTPSQVQQSREPSLRQFVQGLQEGPLS
jgi:phospholipid/cholesterol/gamma-HCH transport system ATP-binding protein